MPSATAPSPNTPKRKRFDSPQQEAFLNLWRTYDRMRLLEEQLFDQYDLTPQQYNALRLLRAAQPKSIPTLNIASRLISRAPDITRLLDKLHDRKLVDRRRPDNNRRTVMINITPAGLELLDKIALAVRDCHTRQLGHLSPSQMRTLIDLLQKARAPHEPQGSDWS
ncbi:MAG TPA: MarR family winged helix-turn-helix transcriptional regulator [Tepidisphaeraceae bacterium]|nr:MarR family winged helix-turn-helix transcriptional regulator [Tepidisphaeraceae bacterium]